MNAVFGSGNWTQASFLTVNVGAMLSPTTCLIFIEGGDANANALNTFLTANLTAIQNWVWNGGRLLINSAPNQGANINFGFGGVTLNYNGMPSLSTPGAAAPGMAGHAVFTGSHTPCGIAFTGNWFSHGYITGGGTSAIIAGTLVNTPTQVITLCEKPWGSGLAMFGSMTTTNFHLPQPNSNNLLNNILSYLYICCPVTAAASPTNICLGSGSNLTGSGAVSYTWFPGNITGPSIVVNPMTSSVYTVVGTNSIGCINSTTIGIVVDPPCITVTSSSISCATLGSATVVSTGGAGPFSYTWMPTNQTSSVATGLSPGTYTLTVHDIGNNWTYTTTTVLTSTVPFTGNLVHTPSLACNGVTSGTAAVLNISGGSGNHYYTWSSGALSYTVPNPTNLGAGVWNLNITDALTGCQINQLFIITQPFAQNLILTPGAYTACPGGVISYTASNSGGTPGPGAGYTYTWTGGVTGPNFTVTQNFPGNYIYVVSSSDGNNCVVSQTVPAYFVANPSLTVTNVSICPFETGTLVASGATSYTWNNIAPGSSYAQSPANTTQYTVLGSAQGCTASATASIILKSVPNPTFFSNSPICQNNNLMFSASGGTAYLWTGVSGFTSTNQSNTLNSALPAQSGVYQVMVTAANSCTATTQGTVTVYPTPSVSATGATVCVTQTLSFNANSFPGANFVWQGPNNFVSLLQNPSISNPNVSASGFYTVSVTSAQGCTNSAAAHASVTAVPVINFSSNSPQCFGKTLSFYAANTIGAQNYNWSGPNGFSSTAINPSIPNVTLPASGNYVLTVSTGPCVVNASISATIHPLPQPVAFNTAPACEGKAFQMGVNSSGVTYTWTGPNGYSNNQQNFTIANSQLNQTGMYTVQVTDANTCQNFNTTSVTILPNPVVNAAGDLVCFGQPAQLSATGADNYYWQGPGTYTAVGANPIVDPTINTQVWTYTVMGTAANGCTAVTTATIGTRVLPLPTLSVTPRVCVLSTVYLNGNGGLSYYWTGPLNYSSSQQNTSFVAGNIGMSGIYTLMVMDAFGCRGYTTAPVIVDPEPTGQIAGKLSGCVPFCSTYSLQSSEGNVINSIWTFNNQSVNSSTVSYCFNTPGNFELKGSFEDDKTCRGTITQMVKVFPLPVADFDYSPAKPIENQDLVVFTNTSEGENQNKWQWAINDGKNTNSFSENTSCFFEDAGNYAVAFLVRNSWGCWDTIVKSIEVALDFNVYIPNAFTPNEDGLNDVFFPVMRGVKRYELQIFNRWGELIFSTSSPDRNWDGTLQGEPCPQGIYNYKLNVLNNKSQEMNYNGVITLYR